MAVDINKRQAEKEDGEDYSGNKNSFFGAAFGAIDRVFTAESRAQARAALLEEDADDEEDGSYQLNKIEHSEFEVLKVLRVLKVGNKVIKARDVKALRKSEYWKLSPFAEATGDPPRAEIFDIIRYWELRNGGLLAFILYLAKAGECLPVGEFLGLWGCKMMLYL